jgi:hypothetical protein
MPAISDHFFAIEGPFRLRFASTENRAQRAGHELGERGLVLAAAYIDRLAADRPLDEPATWADL